MHAAQLFSALFPYSFRMPRPCLRFFMLLFREILPIFLRGGSAFCIFPYFSRFCFPFRIFWTFSHCLLLPFSFFLTFRMFWAAFHTSWLRFLFRMLFLDDNSAFRTRRLCFSHVHGLAFHFACRFFWRQFCFCMSWLCFPFCILILQTPTRLLHVFHVMILSHTALHLSRSSFVCYFGRERENPNKGTRGGERIPWKNRKKMKIGSWQIPWGLILYKSCRNRQLPLLASGARFTRADIENCIV